MYASFFGLRELPFNNTPDPRFFYSTPDHEEALASLIYSIDEGKGFVLLTGEVGAGKTLVTRLMLRHFNDRISFASINHTQVSANELLRCICGEFKIDVVAHASNAELIRHLHDFLVARFADNRPVVLMLDEAQALSREAFEQVRMIGNLEADDAKLLQIVIVGQPELRERFEANDMRQLRQRIFRSFHLSALTRTQTEGYIRHRLSVAGAQYPERVFNSEAIDVIHEYAQGLPRLINTVCDNAMLGAYASDQLNLDGDFVRRGIDQMMTVAQGGPVFASPRVPANDGTPRRRATDSERTTPVTDQPAAAAPKTKSEPAPTKATETPPPAPATRADQDAADKTREAMQNLARQISTDIDAAGRLNESLQTLVNRAVELESTIAPGIERLNAAGRWLTNLLEETQTAGGNLRESMSAARAVEADAKRALNRLAEQATRTAQLSVNLRKVFDKLNRRAADIEQRSTRLKVSGGSVTRQMIDGHARRLETAIDTNRSAIAEVRSLISSATTAPLTIPAGSTIQPAALTGSSLGQRVKALSALIDEVRSDPRVGTVAVHASGE